MPASAARIAFCIEPMRSYVKSDTAIQTRYGVAARDTLAEPVETFFDSMADVATICDERFALLSGDRYKFQLTLAGVLDMSGSLDYASTAPTVTVVDSEKGASMAAMIVGIGPIDYEANKTTLTCWG